MAAAKKWPLWKIIVFLVALPLIIIGGIAYLIYWKKATPIRTETTIGANAKKTTQPTSQPIVATKTNTTKSQLSSVLNGLISQAQSNTGVQATLQKLNLGSFGL